MQTIIAFLFVLGVLVFVHELGHFLAARRLGVRVLTFSLGFRTEAAENAPGRHGILHQRDPTRRLRENGGRESGRSAHRPTRRVPVSNEVGAVPGSDHGTGHEHLLAVVVMAVVLAQGTEVPVYQDEPPVVGVVTPGSPAEQRQTFVPGDRILSVAGEAVETWEDLFIAIGTRRKQRRHRQLRPRWADTLCHGQTRGRRALRGRPHRRACPTSIPIIAQVIPGEPAEKAGLKAGDIVLAVNGVRMATRDQLIEAISRNGGREIDLTIQRGDQQLQFRATPEQRGARGMLGVYIREPTRTVESGCARSDSDEHRAEHRVQRADLPHARRPFRRRNLAAAAQGPGRRSRSSPGSRPRPAGSRSSR